MGELLKAIIEGIVEGIIYNIFYSSSDSNKRHQEEDNKK